MPALHSSRDYEPHYEYNFAGGSGYLNPVIQPNYAYAVGGNGSNVTYSSGGIGGGGSGAHNFDGSVYRPGPVGPSKALAWLDAEIEKICRLAR